MPGLDNTRLYMSLTAGAGTRCMSLLFTPPSLSSLNSLAGGNGTKKCRYTVKNRE